MSDYDYGNARLRVMKSRLLSRKGLEGLANSGSLNGLIAALSQTAYRSSIEAALSLVGGKECVDLALRKDLAETLDRILGFYTGDTRETVAIVLQRYDILNLKAILRGLSRNAPPNQISLTLVPVGKLRLELLEELAGASEPRAAIDLLASMNSPFAQPFLELRAKAPGADTAQMEIALEQWNFDQARKFLESTSQGDGALAFALKTEADLENFLTIFRFAQAPEERKFLHGWLGTDDLSRLLVGPGHVPFEKFLRAGSEDTVDTAVDQFTGTLYEPSLQAGMKAYAQSGRLSDLERQLQRFHKGWLANQIAKDPLGIGVLLGYLALKENEVSNIRWIAHGISIELTPVAIRAELEFIQ
jgi:V/A-type H+-transporting ATPase subunit C